MRRRAFIKLLACSIGSLVVNPVRFFEVTNVESAGYDAAKIWSRKVFEEAKRESLFAKFVGAENSPIKLEILDFSSGTWEEIAERPRREIDL